MVLLGTVAFQTPLALRNYVLVTRIFSVVSEIFKWEQRMCSSAVGRIPLQPQLFLRISAE